MQTIQIGDLKTNLSKYLRRVRAGEAFVVLDRTEPIADLVPRPAEPESERERLVSEGRVRGPTRRLSDVRLSPLGRSIDVQGALDAVREDVR